MKLKQLLSVVLMLCMVASSCVAFAAPQFDAAYECSGVSFGYQDGETWTDADSLKGGQEISAKVSVSKTGDKENAVFSLFVYKNGKMYDNEIVTLEVGEEPVEFKATASVPADPEGCQAVAVLWNNFYDMEMICDSALFPSANTKLRGLYADGKLIEGFDPDVTEYSYALATDAEKYPDISWQAADSSVKVTYKKPITFPGKSIVTVEAADGSKTEYTIKYVSEVGDFISNMGGSATNPVYVKGGIKVGSVAYNDRNYTVTAIGDPDYEGADLIQGSIAWQSDATFKSTESDWITFDAARGVTVKVLKSDIGATQHFIDAGFTMETSDLETGFVQTTTNAIKNHTVAMSKHFDAGKVSIPAGNSSTTYIVAILLDPIGGIDEVDPDEPVVPEDESLALESISIDGVALEGFDASVNEYTHILTTAQLTNEASPEVTFTLMDETSTAEVSMPESFPGSVTITVTNAKEEKAEYVINYDAKNLVTNFTNDAGVSQAPVYIPGGLKVGGNVASDRLGETAWRISEHIPSLEGGDTILTPVDGWKDVVSTFSFDLARKGTITVIQNITNQLSAYTNIGFTANEDVKSTKVKILNNAGTDSRIYQFMASKEVEAGNITLPYTKPNMPTLTVFHVVPWSNEVKPDNSILLSDIKIDGVSIADFDSEENTYYVELTPSQLAAKEAPEVTYTFADSGSSATMERPSSFPGSVVITVMGKDDQTNTYTINYSAETVKDLALNEAAGANAPQPVFKQNFKVGDATYSDRNSNFLTSYIDEAYVGKDRILYGLGWMNDWEKQYYTAFTGDRVDWVTFTAARDMEVIVFEAANANSEYVGFTAQSSTTPYITAHASSNGDLNYKYKYTKKFSAGDKVALPNVDVSNRIGTVVINAAPWGGFGEEGDEPVVPPVEPDEPVETALVKTIKVDGNAIANFDAETLTYDVTLTDNQMAASAYPKVTAELNDTEASVNVTEPTSFPGSVNVTVTKGEESKTYTINFVLPEIEVALSEDAHETTSYPKFATGINVGDMIFADRETFPVEAISDSEITSDIIWLKTNLSWQNTPPMSEVYTTTVMPDFITFTAKRGMVVTVYEDTTNNENKFNYWTTETSDTPYILGTHSNPLKYTVKHRRYYEAGDKVEIPNARGTRVFTATIKYLGWDEEAPELDVTIPVVRKISDSDLVMKVTKGDGINVTEGQWSGLSDVLTTKYQLSKEFTDITEPTEISITTDKIAKGYGIIVVAPLDGEATDKNVIVNADGSELEWTEDTSVVADYSYTNEGNEDFDEANATYGRYNDSAVTFSGGTAYVYEKMHNSDDMYITGSKLGWGRSPYTGELHWTGLPQEYIGCNYIVVPFDGGFNGGERTFTFTVDQPVKVWVHSSASNMTVTDTVDETAWTSSQYTVRRRYQNVLDHLSCAYMLRKGYINESNIVYDGTVGSTNGVRFNRYDVYEKLKADCGSYLGWAIDPEKVEATGFTDTINDYRYEEYLEAWVD